MNRKWAIALLPAILGAIQPAGAQETYRRPPVEIQRILDAPASPTALVSPAGNAMILATPVSYRPISDLAEPMLRGAGTRINPRNNAPHLFAYNVALALRRLPGGAEVNLALPPGARIADVRWNASGTMFAFTNTTSTTVELWVGDAATGKLHRLEGIRLNSVLGYPIAWMPDQKTLKLCTLQTQRSY